MPEHQAPYYTLAPAASPPAGPYLAAAGGPPHITANPRRLRPSDVTEDDPVTALSRRSCALLTLRPSGDVTTDETGAAECRAGWAITGRARDLGLVAGPQYAAIMAIITDATRIFSEASPADERAADTYLDTVDAMHGAPETRLAWAASVLAAAAALAAAGADTEWWSRAGTSEYGHLVLAVAARDLIGTTPLWTQGSYDLLTIPWLAATSQPAHPADITALTRRAAP
jgi:hypothetical protein